MSKYRIIVHNNQGASSSYSADTKSQIQAWLNGWDSENLTAKVFIEDSQIGEKDFGSKTINWGANQ